LNLIKSGGKEREGSIGSVVNTKKGRPKREKEEHVGRKRREREGR